MADDPSNFQAARGRRVLLTRRGRERFGETKRKRFLEWFAATCNAKQSARRAGVAYSTVKRTRMVDGRFAEAWDRALVQGYAWLEAKLLELQFDQAAGEPLTFDGALEPDAPDLALTDPTMALQLLRLHKPEVMRIRGSQGTGGAGARPASDAEVRRALVRSLKAFGVRVTKEDLRAEGVRGTSGHGDENTSTTVRDSAPHPPTASRRAPPSPAKGRGVS